MSDCDCTVPEFFIFRVGCKHNRWVVLVPYSDIEYVSIEMSLPAIYKAMEKKYHNPVTDFDYVEFLGSW